MRDSGGFRYGAVLLLTLAMATFVLAAPDRVVAAVARVQRAAAERVTQPRFAHGPRTTRGG